MNKVESELCNAFDLSNLSEIYDKEPTDAALLIYQIINYLKNNYNIDITLDDLYENSADIMLILQKKNEQLYI